MTIGERLRLFLRAESTTTKALAELSELPYTTLHQYVTGRRSPNADSLTKLALNTPLNLNWLLTGMGEMYREGPPYTRSPGRPSRAPVRPYRETLGTARAAVVAEGQQAWVRLRLGEASLLAGSGSVPLAWDILKILSTTYPEPLPLDALQGALERSGEAFHDSGLLASLVLLSRKGLIEEDASPGTASYRLARPFVSMTSQELEQISHGTMEAIGCLLNDVMPAAEAGRGKVVLAAASVPQGQGRGLLRRLNRAVQGEWEAISRGAEGALSGPRVDPEPAAAAPLGARPDAAPEAPREGAEAPDSTLSRDILTLVLGLSVASGEEAEAASGYGSHGALGD